MQTEEPAKTPKAKPNPLRTWGPLVAIVALMSLVFAMGWHEYLSLEQLGRNYATLDGFISENLLVAILAYALLYIVVVALSNVSVSLIRRAIPTNIRIIVQMTIIASGNPGRSIPAGFHV